MMRYYQIYSDRLLNKITHTIPMLYKISGTQAYLCGSIHLMDQRRMVPRHLVKRFIRAESCIFEIDHDSIEGPPDFSVFADGQSFDGYVSPSLALKTRKLFNQLGMTFDPREKLWAVTNRATVGLYLQSGARFESGIDSQLWKAAKASQKKVGHLESASVLSAFDRSPVEEQIARLSWLVEDPSRSLATLDNLTRAWFAKDLGPYEAELAFLKDQGPCAFRGLMDDRHAAWLPQMLPRIEQGDSVVFIVGALHLAGLSGIPTLLRQYGFEIEPA